MPVPVTSLNACLLAFTEEFSDARYVTFVIKTMKIILLILKGFMFSRRNCPFVHGSSQKLVVCTAFSNVRAVE